MTYIGSRVPPRNKYHEMEEGVVWDVEGVEALLFFTDFSTDNDESY